MEGLPLSRIALLYTSMLEEEEGPVDLPRMESGTVERAEQEVMEGLAVLVGATVLPPVVVVEAPEKAGEPEEQEPPRAITVTPEAINQAELVVTEALLILTALLLLEAEGEAEDSAEAEVEVEAEAPKAEEALVVEALVPITT